MEIHFAWEFIFVYTSNHSQFTFFRFLFAFARRSLMNHVRKLAIHADDTSNHFFFTSLGVYINHLPETGSSSVF